MDSGQRVKMDIHISGATWLVRQKTRTCLKVTNKCKGIFKISTARVNQLVLEMCWPQRESDLPGTSVTVQWGLRHKSWDRSIFIRRENFLLCRVSQPPAACANNLLSSSFIINHTPLWGFIFEFNIV